MCALWLMMEKTCCDIPDWGATRSKDSTHSEGSRAAVFCPLWVWIYLLKKKKYNPENDNTSKAKHISEFLWSIYINYISMILGYIYSFWLTEKLKRLEFTLFKLELLTSPIGCTTREKDWICSRSDTCQHKGNPNSSMCCGLGEKRTEILWCL